MSHSCFRILAAFVLILALAAPWAVAGEPRFRSASPVAPEPATTGFFSSLWGLLTALWSETSCRFDPNGQCLSLSGAELSEADAGCRLDPNGQCLPGS